MEFVRYRLGDPLNQNSYGISEPIQQELIHPEADTIILAPCLGFNHQGGRLGYGGGFYDRYLTKHSYGQVIGVCYDFGALIEMPTDTHDVPLDVGVTNARIVYF